MKKHYRAAVDYAEKISTLTGMPKKQILHILELLVDIMCHDLASAEINQEFPDVPVVVAELPYLGTLTIENKDIRNTVSFIYNFQPTQKFNNEIRAAILRNESSLIERATQKYVEKILKKYEELL